MRCAAELGVITLAVLFTAASAAQQAQGSNDQVADPELLTLKTEARNVIVDVVATDKSGQPVMTLDKSQFEVFENGVPQQIVFFERHAGEQPAAPSAAKSAVAEAAPLPPDTFTNIPSTPAAGPLMVLLLDTLNTRASAQSYVRNQLLNYMKKIPPGTKMAIFMLGDNLRMIQGFTSDPAVLKAALDGKAYPASRPISFETMVAATRGSLSHFANESTDLAIDIRIRMTIEALTGLANYLTAIPGRKSLIWMAGSIPWSINPDFSLVTTVTGRADYSEDLKKLAELMNLGRVSIYPVDARGLLTPPGFAADRSPGFSSASMARNNGGTGRESGAGFARGELNSQMALGSGHISMNSLAAATGGRAFYNTNGLSNAVEKVQSIGEDYYTIAYSPTDKSYDGSMRRIEIKVTDEKLRLDYRRGYYAYDPAKAAVASPLISSNPLRAAMVRGAPDSTAIPFHVEVSQAARQPANADDRIGDRPADLKGMPVARYDFHWTVDSSAIRFTKQPDGKHAAEVDATLAAYDADGKILNSVFARLPLSLSSAQFAALDKSKLPMKLTFDLPGGLVYVRAGVLDPSDGHTGATEFPMMVRAAQTQAQKPVAAAGGHS